MKPSKQKKSIGQFIDNIIQNVLPPGSNQRKAALNSKHDACNRLKLVLMHDRSKLSAGTLEKMKDELVDVISRYVKIDKSENT